MTSTPVRIRDEDKAALERLQMDLAQARGEKPPQQEVVGAAIDFATRHKEAFLSEAAWTPPPARLARRWLAQGEDLGDWSTKDIDDIVYGETS